MALKEICISLIARPRVEEGEIIDVRDPLGGVGLLEGKDFLWLLADDSEISPPDGPKQVVILTALAAREQALDLSRARDRAIHHQPFLAINEQTGLYTAGKPISLLGVVRNKR